MSTTESQVDQAMIDFVNAENHLEKCRRQITNKALGNLNLSRSFYICPSGASVLMSYQHQSSTGSAAPAAHLTL